MDTRNQNTTVNIKKFPSNKTVLITSIFSIIIPSILGILALNNFSIYMKIIVCLSICCIVLLVDVCFYYVKEREYYYVACYLQNNIDLLKSHISQIETKFSD